MLRKIIAASGGEPEKVLRRTWAIPPSIRRIAMDNALAARAI